ncbi:A/G-specific adenine glycosylase [Carnobacteriaceae bacterium 52-44]
MFEIEYTKKELKEKFNIEMWSDKKIETFQEILMDWYDQQEADHNFPWRESGEPYHIWVSEIMLQQTRTDTVIPYYDRFIEAFPTIKDLAEASEDQVLKMWEGLGYYSRAGNLKEAAQQIMIHHDGIFPNNPKEIIQLKGIGPYTAGAISSMAFGLPTPAIDGNLMRVLSRLFEINLDITKAKNRKVFETVALYLIDKERPGDFNQALMDLGRTICTPKNYFPERSPVKEFNASYINDTWHKYPVKKAKNKPKPVTYISLMLQNEAGDYLLERRPETGLLANMWQFPMLKVEDIVTDGTWKPFEPIILETLNPENKEFVEQFVEENYHIALSLNEQTSGVVEHVFSHLKWTVSIFNGEKIENSLMNDIPENCEWVNPRSFDAYTFPTIQKKIWDNFTKITLF